MTRDDTLENMKFGFRHDYLFASGAPGERDCGIVPGHAYSLAGMWENVRGSDGASYDLVLVRNPWGTNSNYPWKGDWSFGDHLWTSTAK